MSELGPFQDVHIRHGRPFIIRSLLTPISDFHFLLLNYPWYPLSLSLPPPCALPPAPRVRIFAAASPLFTAPPPRRLHAHGLDGDRAMEMNKENASTPASPAKFTLFGGDESPASAVKKRRRSEVGVALRTPPRGAISTDVDADRRIAVTGALPPSYPGFGF